MMKMGFREWIKLKTVSKGYFYIWIKFLRKNTKKYYWINVANDSYWNFSLFITFQAFYTSELSYLSVHLVISIQNSSYFISESRKLNWHYGKENRRRSSLLRCWPFKSRFSLSSQICVKCFLSLRAVEVLVLVPWSWNVRLPLPKPWYSYKLVCLSINSIHKFSKKMKFYSVVGRNQ